MEILAITWEDIQSSLLKLADKITDSGFRPEMIVGIARGGWVVARILSDLLDVGDLASIKIEFYREMNERERTPKITQPISESPTGKVVLIADDVADTGESLILAKHHLADLGASSTKLATLHLKPWSKIVPDYYVSTTEDWVMYPWEIRETLEHLVRIWRDETTNPDELKARISSTGIPKEIIERYMNNGSLERKFDANPKNR